MNYWNNLSGRDRIAAIIGLSFLVIYLFYLVIYSPLTSAVTDKTTQLKDKRETLHWMQQIKIKPTDKTNRQTINNGRLISLISTQLNSGNLQKFPYQLQQTSTGEIQLSFDAVPYNQFLTWLWLLNTQYSISIKQLIIERSQTAGIVKLSIIITAKITD